MLLNYVDNYICSYTTNFIVLLYQNIKMIKQLTKAEEQIMQVLWKLEKAFLREIIDALPEPKPHNNTVATVLLWGFGSGKASIISLKNALSSFHKTCIICSSAFVSCFIIFIF